VVEQVGSAPSIALNSRYSNNIAPSDFLLRVGTQLAFRYVVMRDKLC
jgi:hypothetical protein